MQHPVALPKVFSVDHDNGRNGRIKVVKQSRVDADTAGGVIPVAIRLKSRAVTVGAAAASRAKVVHGPFGLPTVNCFASAVTCEVKLRWFVVRMQHASL